jgi:transcriptional regulator with XRE-family HTH domain
MPHAKPDIALSATVRRLREDRGVTREALAMEAAVTTGSLARIELAQASPSWDTFRRIAGALELSISGLAAAIEVREQRSHQWAAMGSSSADDFPSRPSTTSAAQ